MQAHKESNSLVSKYMIKVDQSTSLCNLMVNINDYVKGEGQSKNSKLIVMLMLYNRLFGRVDDIINRYAMILTM